MGCCLVIDTNVFLLASEDANCQRVVKCACYSWEHGVIIDIHGAIQREYKEHSRNTDAIYLREFYKRLVNHEESDPRARAALIRIRCRLDAGDQAFLAGISCTQPVEPQLFGVACGQEDTYLIIPSLQWSGQEPIKRGYRDNSKLDMLRDHFRKAGKPLRVKTTADIDFLYEPGSSAPRTYTQLQQYLDDRFKEEHQYLEFKSVKVPDGGVTMSIADTAMEAIVMIANSGHAGYVMIGVDPAGEITGVSQAYAGEPKMNWDDLWGAIFSNRKQQFSPDAPIMKEWFIQLPDKAGEPEKAVLVVRVHMQAPGFSYTPTTGKTRGRKRTGYRVGAMNDRVYLDSSGNH